MRAGSPLSLELRRQETSCRRRGRLPRGLGFRVEGWECSGFEGLHSLTGRVRLITTGTSRASLELLSMRFQE